MDNPHTLVDPTELAYLAGIIDGEGTISIVHGEWSEKRKSFKPAVEVVNCDMLLINYIKDIMNRLGANAYITTKARKSGRNHNPAYTVGTRIYSKCLKILEAVHPYLVLKKERAEIVMEFIKSRIHTTLAKGYSPKAVIASYSKAELQLVKRIRLLNRRGVSETEDQGLEQMLASAR